MDRRRLLRHGVALPLAAALPPAIAATGTAPAAARSPARYGGADAPAVPIGDMHAHLFFIGQKPASRHPLGPAMAAGGATLVAWSLVGDLPWLAQSPRGLKQKSAPAKGAATAWFEAEAQRIRAHVAEQGLALATRPADVDAAVGGAAHVVLAVEGATFLDDGIAGLEAAYAAGVRHLQLVHYIRNGVGDFQTERPEHGGLTELGRSVVAACNRLGILVDVAHCTDEVVAQVLDISTVPIVWSHGSVTAEGRPSWRQVAWQARRLPLATARAITAKGGVVGLWGLRSDVGGSVESYAQRLVEMAGWLGHEHVAFGTDIGAITGSPVASFADLRRVVGVLASHGLGEAELRAVAIANYARVLKQAMAAARA